MEIIKLILIYHVNNWLIAFIGRVSIIIIKISFRLI